MAPSAVSTSNSEPPLRWGILATGWISDKFVRDLLLARKSAKASHQLICVGSSSTEKAGAFVDKIWSEIGSSATKPTALGDYESVFSHPEVDIVYIGTPHALHRQNSLDAIAAGKHVLCEKPFTINEREAQEVFAAAKARGVFVMEGVWTRFLPIMASLRKMLYEEEVIGHVHRLFCDFGLFMPLSSLPADSRLKDPNLGAGALLDIGIYPLTLASMILGEFRVGDDHPPFEVVSSLAVESAIDYQDAVILKYLDTNRMAICTSSLLHKTSNDFCRIEGSEGHITLFGPAASVPTGLRVKTKSTDAEKVVEFDREGGMGLFYEADAIALDIKGGRKGNDTMPWAETLRMMRLLDGIRQAGGVRYPHDE
ncbi:sulfate adenylyltransferase [Fonsecaea nubica]|uniref:D-xylose 1-dehydrogenase (NADP(+), D-xylono-1,5-lactone-forming) n=1 Tax=Fonsecaea nubica TaxID=856822 RepID=A0A178CES7_9EURO|nr:sulfate adenylyltransferase [Fonsecaea nubica]OAL28489.1 sulfate adenylyltransferase [Fonsecaea nubica]